MKNKIIEILLSNIGQPLSGETLSQQLGISRAAVWKHMKNLRSEGCNISAVNNRGYTLLSMPDSIHPEFFNALFSGRRQLHYFDNLLSTNDKAKELAKEGCPSGTLVIADTQTGGKGRLGRSWVSVPGKGVWMSIVLRPRMHPSQMHKITIIGALAAVQTITVLTGLPVKIKWPNDIMINGKKVCGILCEMSADMDEVDYLVMGIGLNANLDSEDFPEELKKIATSLKIESGCPVSRLELASSIANRVCEIMNFLEETGDFSSVVKEYKNYEITGRVRAFGSGRDVTGLAEGIDEDGALVLLTDKGDRLHIISGEISVRSIEGE
ncbi:MAG: biotin--[acetyl-CoA-carboxylase] ligase [Christensenellales bacterium]